MSEGHTFRGRIDGTLRMLAALVSASSLISLIQHVGDIGLVGIFETYIKLYRDIAYPIVGFLPSLIDLHPPATLKDLWTLSGFFSVVYAKAIVDTALIMIDVGDGPTGRRPAGKPWLWLTVLVATYTLLGLITVGWAFRPQRLDADEFDRIWEEKDFSKLKLYRSPLTISTFRKWLLSAVTAMVIFFVLNAFVGFMR